MWKYVGKIDAFAGNEVDLYEKLNKKLHEWVARMSYTNELHEKVAWYNVGKKKLSKKKKVLTEKKIYIVKERIKKVLKKKKMKEKIN